MRTFCKFSIFYRAFINRIFTTRRVSFCIKIIFLVLIHLIYFYISKMFTNFYAFSFCRIEILHLTTIYFTESIRVLTNISDSLPITNWWGVSKFLSSTSICCLMLRNIPASPRWNFVRHSENLSLVFCIRWEYEENWERKFSFSMASHVVYESSKT